jgi:uncharacterized protein YcgI (DUF1989 family)
MLILVRDTVGRHDLLMPACSPPREGAAGAGAHRSCTENAAEALRAIGVTVPRLYDPVNLFMNVALHPDNRLTFEPSLSRAGGLVMFRTAMDLLCVLSACPMEPDGTRARRATDLRVRVHGEP